MSLGRVFSVIVFVLLCFYLYLKVLNDVLHNEIPSYGSANLSTSTDMDLVDWRQRRGEVEKYCEAQRLNSRQRQQLPMGISK